MTPDAPPSARRVEEASLNAWPALSQLLVDGWVVRFARGFTKRANSVVPLYPSARDPLEKVRFCENLYARERLTPIFRLTSLDDHSALDALLERRGYRRMDPTLVMTRPLEPMAPPLARGFSSLARGDWLTLYADITSTPATALQLHGLLLQGIRTEHTLGAMRADAATGGWAACGLAVTESELVGLFDVATRDTLRRRGHGRALVESLLHCGARAGARHAYLQVLEENAAARRLYDALGFGTSYSYWYRIGGG
jgi:GNAT superfamily N-acetyltransferase